MVSQTASDRASGHVFSKNSQRCLCLLKPKVLHDVRMVAIFQYLNLCFGSLSAVISATSTGSYGDFNLFDSDHLACGGIESEIHMTISSFGDELTTDSFKYPARTTCLGVKVCFRLHRGIDFLVRLPHTFVSTFR